MYLTVMQAAAILGLSKYQVYRRIVRGDITASITRQGNLHYLVSRDSVDAYLRTGSDVLSPAKADPAMLRVSDVATMTGFTVETVRRMCHTGRLPSIKGSGPRGQLRIPRDAVLALLDLEN